MVKNPSANEENMNLTPNRRRSHVPWSNYAPAQKLLSVCSQACMPHSYQVHMPRHDRKRSRLSERTLQQGVSPLTTTRENPHAAKKTQDSQKLIRKTVGSANLQRRQKNINYFYAKFDSILESSDPWACQVKPLSRPWYSLL